MNTLYYGDNLKILREYIKDETVDLVYLDPPFNSNRNYNVLFKDESGKEADANRDYPKMQILTIEDLLNGKELQIPGDLGTFKQAEKVNTNKSTLQNAFDFE
jgi:16S rRNA G966 N2-methylase RsmD